MNSLSVVKITADELPVAVHPQHVAHAATQFVQLKFHSDKSGAGKSSNGALHAVMPLNYTSIRQLNPAVFARKLIPFLSACKRGLVAEVMRVPATQVIGESSRWDAGEMTLRQRRAVIHASERAMDDFLAGGSGDAEVAQYSVVEGLGVYIAATGAHRVGVYLGNSDGVHTIPALVTTIDYPDADRMKIVTTQWGRMIAILDDRWVFPLALPSHQVPLLTAHGVREAEWPCGVVCEREHIENWLIRQSRLDGEVLPAIDALLVLQGQDFKASYPIPA